MLELLKDDTLFNTSRYYFGARGIQEFKKIFIHGFCDASELAYAAVIYIVGETDGETKSKFVVAKTKVTPIAKTSTPRLELFACVLLANLMANVKESMSGNIDPVIVCWSDSMDALFWIKNEQKKRKQFIQTRVMKIRGKVNAEHWRYCPTTLNPADVASRGLKTTQSIDKEFLNWTTGPDFIRKKDTEWPSDLSKNLKEKSDTDTEEINVNCALETENKVICLHVTNDVTGKKTTKIKVFQQQVKLDELIDIQRYSCLHKLLRITALILRFIDNVKSRRKGEIVTKGYLNQKEMKAAEIVWIKSVQREIETNSKQLNNTLGLFVDEQGVILCRGRLENAELTSTQKNPILIPGNSYFAKLLALDAHYKTGHGTKKDTLVELRSKYWVTKARNLVRHVIHGCARPCRRLESKAFKSVERPPLPYFRVRQSFPFANTGLDYLGPMAVRQVFDENNTNMHKVWVVLYTCAVTRAVHLDLVPNTSASAFIRSLKRFIGRRGVPNMMISDNASCFKNEEVKLNAELLEMGVKWRFIVEASPWWGGFWERLVQTVKKSLRKVLFHTSVNYEELQSIIIEIEGIVNSRPLTYMYDDDAEEILTPSHLLLGRRLLSNFTEPFYEGYNVDNAVITTRMKYLKSLSDHYWKRFKDEYLLELRLHHVQGSDPARTPEIGEVVVVEGKAKRNEWRLGKIIELIRGNDERCRAAVIKIFDGTNVRYLRRPIERLYPIEIKSTIPVTNSDTNVKSVLDIDRIEQFDNPTRKRPVRIAANEGIIRRRLAEQDY